MSLSPRPGATVTLLVALALMSATLFVGGTVPAVRNKLWSRWLFTFPATGPGLTSLALVDDCDVPGHGDDSTYALVSEERLPWKDRPPRALTTAHKRGQVDGLVVAFRTTLMEPMFDEVYNVARGAAYLAGSMIAPGEVLSLNDTIAPYSRERGYRDGPTYVRGNIVPTVGGGVCKIASALYNVAIFGDLEIVERHPHSLPVPYVPPGRDATVVYGHKDLKVRNPTPHAVLLWAAMDGPSLFVALYGSYEPPTVTWCHEELARRPRSTIRRPNAALMPGEERIVLSV